MSTSTQTFRGKVDASQAGDPYFKDIQTTTTPGSLQTPFTQTLAADKNVYLLQAYVVCRHETKWEIKIDSDVVASGRTGHSETNVNFSFLPYRIVEASETLKVEVLAMSGKPASDLEVYIQGREITL